MPLNFDLIRGNLVVIIVKTIAGLATTAKIISRNFVKLNQDPTAGKWDLIARRTLVIV